MRSVKLAKPSTRHLQDLLQGTHQGLQVVGCWKMLLSSILVKHLATPEIYAYRFQQPLRCISQRRRSMMPLSVIISAWQKNRIKNDSTFCKCLHIVESTRGGRYKEWSQPKTSYSSRNFRGNSCWELWSLRTVYNNHELDTGWSWLWTTVTAAKS